YFALPGGHPLFIAAITIGAVGAIGWGIHRMHPQRAGAWQLLAVAIALLGIGDVIFVGLDAVSPAPVPYPAAPDAFYIATYLPLTVGLFWLGRPPTRYHDETTLIDSVSVTLGGSLIVWITVVRPGLENHALSPAGRAAAVAGWVGYIAVFSAS